MRVAFVDDVHETYSGYNPSFYARVQRRRREAEARQRQHEMAAAREEQKRRKAEYERQRRALAKQAEENAKAVSEYKSYVVREAAPIADKPRARDIIADVAVRCGVPYEDIMGPRRSVDIVTVRHLAMRAVADARPDMSLPQIGRAFNRDHTSVLAALRKTRQPGRPR